MHADRSLLSCPAAPYIAARNKWVLQVPKTKHLALGHFAMYPEQHRRAHTATT
jgi:hypothetical protein